MRRQFSETDLAEPLYRHLAQLGYTVRSEVKDCDIAAVKGDDLLVIELKKTMNLTLVAQAVRRQRLTDSVYVAIPRPANKWKWWKESRSVQHLLRRLELGLILVSLEKGKPPVEVIFHPVPFTRRMRAATRRAVLEEIAHRTADYNRAGSTRTKLATAYRENAIFVACCLHVTGRTSPAALRAMGTGQKTLSILRLNAYGWFERVDTGVYALAPHALDELKAWPELKKRYLAVARRAARKSTVANAARQAIGRSAADARKSTVVNAARQAIGRSAADARKSTVVNAARPGAGGRVGLIADSAGSTLSQGE
jgi:hypothetical protein